jgi:hypothetical protein
MAFSNGTFRKDFIADSLSCIEKLRQVLKQIEDTNDFKTIQKNLLNPDYAFIQV